MDFVIGLPLTQKKHDAIWVIVDKLTKSAHFLPVQTDYSLERLVELYTNEIVQLHGLPVSIIFLQRSKVYIAVLQEALGTQLHFSTTFQP